MTVWDSLIGQPRAVDELRRAAEAGRGVLAGDDEAALAHSWLITGPPGSGRSIAARCLAAALQCTGTEAGCGECSGCHTTMVGSHPDVRVMATELVQIKIDDVRELVAVAQQRPTLGRWRVIIVEDADRMIERTSNVLLKTLEEPPPRTIWILCAPTPGDLLVTIRSRCRHLQLATPSAAAVAELVARVEGVPYPDALVAAQVSQSHVGVARALARQPELRRARADMFMSLLRVGSVGEAVVAAGRLVEAAKESGAEQAQQRDVAEKAELMTALGIEDGRRVPPALRAQLRQLEEDQKRRAKRSQADALDRAMIDLLSFFRDVMVVQAGAGEATDLINADLVDEISGWASSTTTADTLARTAAVDLARERLRGPVAPLLLVEALAVSLFDPSLAES